MARSSALSSTDTSQGVLHANAFPQFLATFLGFLQEA